MSAGPHPSRPAALWWRRAVAEYLPPLVVGILLLPWIMAEGRAWPWRPAMIDLDVYRLAVQQLLDGRDLYATHTPRWRLPFIYPPIAAVIMAPLALGPVTFWRLVWAVLLVWAQQSVLRRCGLPRGIALGLVGAVVLVVLEPLRATLGYGQVNTLLMALVVADLLPSREEERRWAPQGSLIGLAAAIKLTPLLFVAFLVVQRRWRAAGTAVASFVLLTLVGAVVLWPETKRFFGGLSGGDAGVPASPIYVGNQSLTGALTRALGDDGKGVVTLALALAAVLTLVALWAAATWWLAAPVTAVALVGLTACLASPISWTHHHVWILPLLAALLVRERLPGVAQVIAGLLVLWVGGGFVLWALPVGWAQERAYGPGQVLLSCLTPVLTAALAVTLAIASPGGPGRTRRLPRAAR